MFKKVQFGPTKTTVEKRADGSILYANQQQLADHPGHLLDYLDKWVKIKPEHTFLAERREDDAWQRLSYQEAFEQIEKVSQYLLHIGFEKEDTLILLSENSIENAIMALGALKAGLTFAPISPPYSLWSDNFEKLTYCTELTRPAFVFAQNGKTYQKALEVVKSLSPGVRIICEEESPDLFFDDLLSHDFTGKKPLENEIAKILFTSGSTDRPKGVINTHAIWCANLQQISQALAFMFDESPVFIDWLPWHHTFGGNHNLGLTLMHGGSLYLDDGKPTPKDIEKTVRNLREISPTSYFNVPKGLEMLLDYLENDEELSQTLFKKLQMLFYAGAGLSQPVWDRWEALALKTTGFKIPIISGLGCTESGPSAMFANWSGAFSGLLGVPVAGLQVKLVPVEDKLEARYKGPNVTPGYWRDPEKTMAAFDEEGFYKTGDAVKFLDAANPDKGLLFNGRLSEDFKLSSGTWVSVGVLRQQLIYQADPLIQDVVLTGLNEDFIGAILFLNLATFQKLIHPTLSYEELSDHPLVNEEIEKVLRKFNASATGSSNTILKYVIAKKPPSADLGEITDKGSVNQRAVLSHRAELIDQMYRK